MPRGYEELNRAQSVATGPHGRLLRLVSRIAMLTIEVPAAMRAGDWPEQRRLRGDLDEALARLVDLRGAAPPAALAGLDRLAAAGDSVVRAIVATPRGSREALADARRSSGVAVGAVEDLSLLLDVDTEDGGDHSLP
ncbi:MAG: hypothetical protein GEU28_01405 [Dehalococcoidia bacterium]|nr:hypothetical protein [Dehalococcoidia bacterium]